jgi:dolichol-phosphate mannosyltransferase
MYRGKSIAVILPALDEEGKIERSVARQNRDIVDRVIVVDDGSRDATAARARAAGAEVVSHAHNQGVGAAIRTGIRHAAAAGIDLTGIMAGDDQDNPEEITRLADPIVNDGYDFIQGSRYLPGGAPVNQPASRTLMTRGYSVAFSIFLGKAVTDATNGYKLFRTEAVAGMDLDQPWLNRYELEPYILWNAVRTLRWREVGVTKTYPAVRQVGYTKMKIWRDWWGISRPMLLLALRLKH